MRIAYSLNKKRLIAAAVLIVCSLTLCLHVHATPKFSLVLCLCLAAGGFLDLKISGRLSVPVMPLAALAASLLTVLLAQEANGIRRMLAPKLVLMGAACVLLRPYVAHDDLAVYPDKCRVGD